MTARARPSPAITPVPSRPPCPGWPAHYSNTQTLDWCQQDCSLAETSQPVTPIRPSGTRCPPAGTDVGTGDSSRPPYHFQLDPALRQQPVKAVPPLRPRRYGSCRRLRAGRYAGISEPPPVSPQALPRSNASTRLAHRFLRTVRGVSPRQRGSRASGRAAGGAWHRLAPPLIGPGLFGPCAVEVARGGSPPHRGVWGRRTRRKQGWTPTSQDPARAQTRSPGSTRRVGRHVRVNIIAMTRAASCPGSAEVRRQPARREDDSRACRSFPALTGRRRDGSSPAWDLRCLDAGAAPRLRASPRPALFQEVAQDDAEVDGGPARVLHCAGPPQSPVHTRAAISPRMPQPVPLPAPSGQCVSPPEMCSAVSTLASDGIARRVSYGRSRKRRTVRPFPSSRRVEEFAGAGLGSARMRP